MTNDDTESSAPAEPDAEQAEAPGETVGRRPSCHLFSNLLILSVVGVPVLLLFVADSRGAGMGVAPDGLALLLGAVFLVPVSFVQLLVGIVLPIGLLHLLDRLNILTMALVAFPASLALAHHACLAWPGFWVGGRALRTTGSAAHACADAIDDRAVFYGGALTAFFVLLLARGYFHSRAEGSREEQ